MGTWVASIPLLATTSEDREHWWIVAPFFWLLWIAVIGTILFFVFRTRPSVARRRPRQRDPR